MGYDIDITLPDGDVETHFYITYNHSVFKDYFYPRNYNGCNAIDVVIALAAAIDKFRGEGIEPFPLPNPYGNIHGKSFEEKYYEASKEVYMAILIAIRDSLEVAIKGISGTDLIWTSD